MTIIIMVRIDGISRVNLTDNNGDSSVNFYLYVYYSKIGRNCLIPKAQCPSVCRVTVEIQNFAGNDENLYFSTVSFSSDATHFVHYQIFQGEKKHSFSCV